MSVLDGQKVVPPAAWLPVSLARAHDMPAIQPPDPPIHTSISSIPSLSWPLQLFGASTGEPAAVSLPVMSTLRDGEGDGGIPISHGALTSPDTLSDTKIFVLLAAIVFIFLIALGVAMARVSHSRRQQQDEQITQQIIAAQRPPETLNKSILDLLPVFEITEKRQLRRLHLRSPRAMLNECFAEGYAECSISQRAQYLDSTGECSSAGFAGQRSVRSSAAESAPEKTFQHSPLPACCREPDILSLSDQSHACGPAHSRSLRHEWDSRAPHPVQSLRVLEKSGRDMTPRSIRSTTLSSSASHTGGVAARCHRSTAPRARPLVAPARHSYAWCKWDGATPVSYRTPAIDPGVIAYDDRRSRSLDLTPERELTVSTACTGDPLPDWLISQSHPEITRKTTCRSSTSTDDEDGLGACPICLEEFAVGDHLRELPCMHKYHVICIDTWLVSRSTCCPYCKLDIRRWYYGPEFEEEIPRSGPHSGTSQPLDFHELPMSRRDSMASMMGRDSAAIGTRWARVRRAMRQAFEYDEDHIVM